MFRHPVLQPSLYLDLYTNGAEDEWSADDARQDLVIIRRMIAQRACLGSVLDVGCGAGDFLLTLPAELMKFGVEPSTAAAAAARARGVSVLSPTLAQLSLQATFDVITMIDVIEHVADPGELLDQALSHLAAGGHLIVATGDAGNVLWRRIFRSRFWYSSFPEHITFPSLRYFHIWHEGKGLQAPTSVQLKYRRIPFWRVVAYFASQLAYLVSPWLMNGVAKGMEWLSRAPRPRRRFFSPGAPGVFTDHQIVVLRRLP
jgi:SAM-dependent methyltransferase